MLYLKIRSLIRRYNLTNIFQSFRFTFTFLIILIVWIYGLIVLIRITKDFRNARKEEAFYNELARNSTIEAIQLIDSYCRQLDRTELEKAQLQIVSQEMSEKDESELKLLIARKDKLIRDNLLYVPELNQMWCLVPKAASTSWSAVIASNLDPSTWNFTSSSHNDSVSMQVILKELYGNVNKIKYERAVHNEQVQKILLVRHPFARIVSAFEDKLRNRNARSDGAYFFQHFGSQIYQKYRKNRHVKPEEPTFTEFIEYLVNTDPMEYDEHWKPISLLCGLCSVHYDLVIKVEKIQTMLSTSALFNQLKFRKEAKLPWLNQIHSAHNISKYFHQISKAKLVCLYKKYEHDFHLFGYNFIEY